MTPPPLRFARSGSVATVALRFSASEPVSLRATVTPLGSSSALRLRRGTVLAGRSCAGTAATAAVSRGGVYMFRARLAAGRLVKGRAYSVRIVATDAAGHSSTLAIRARS